MTEIASLDQALAALDDCASALETLDARCCEPGRSPRMKALAATLAAARISVEDAGADPAQAEAALVEFEEAGSQVGRLQVGCCAPDRLPLYAEILEGLTTAQIAVNASTGRGH